MRIFGIDFTSAPNTRKPITCAVCWLDQHTLLLEALVFWPSFTGFELHLQANGPWVGAFDFPFGQPHTLITALGWPTNWAGYVTQVANLPFTSFAERLAAFRNAQPVGQKQPPRTTDIPAQSRSAMMLYGVPVGRMFFQGAPRLLASGVSVHPCRPNQSGRVVLEAYPRLVANRWIARASYKHDTPQRQSAAHTAQRAAILAGICGQTASLAGETVQSMYGAAVSLNAAQYSACLSDATGDTLDAVLAALQAAWAFRQPGYGIPAGHETEGWIVDPATRAQ